MTHASEVMRETVAPGGATAGGGIPPHVVVPVPVGGAVASGVAPTVIIGPPLIPLLAEAIRRLDELSTSHWHLPAEHHDPIALYTEIGVALAAFVIAILLMLGRLRT
jgi:hypothetical protein